MPSTLSSADPIRRHHLEARLLGGMSLYYNGQSLPETAFRRHKSLILLFRLLVEPTHSLPVDDILELFWPDQDPRNSAANLRSVLIGIRGALPDQTAPNPVVRLDATLALDPTLDLVLDVDQFEAAERGQSSAGPGAATGRGLNGPA